MIIYPLKRNYACMQHNNRNANNQQPSFQGLKPQVQTKNAVGCVGNILLLALLAPLALLSGLFQNNKKDEIGRLTLCMQMEYKKHCGDLEYFQNNINKMNKIIDKHTINDSYAQFAKESMEFLLTNFKNNQGACDECYRLEVFNKGKRSENLAFIKFMDTLRKSAIVAVSKKHKDIDISELDKNIQEARDIMKNTNL